MPSGQHGLVLLNCNYNFFSYVVRFTFCMLMEGKMNASNELLAAHFLSTQYFTNVYTFDFRNERLLSKVNSSPLHNWLDVVIGLLFTYFVVKMREKICRIKPYIMYFIYLAKKRFCVESTTLLYDKLDFVIWHSAFFIISLDSNNRECNKLC